MKLAEDINKQFEAKSGVFNPFEFQSEATAGLIKINRKALDAVEGTKDRKKAFDIITKSYSELQSNIVKYFNVLIKTTQKANFNK